MVIDAGARNVARSGLASRSLSRAEVIAQPIAHDFFALCFFLHCAMPSWRRRTA